jgi:hypothetical protein
MSDRLARTLGSLAVAIVLTTWSSSASAATRQRVHTLAG